MHTHIDDLSLVLGEIALFRGLPSSAISDIARSTQVLSLPKGSKVYSAGERPRALYHVMSGHLKVAVCSSKGARRLSKFFRHARFSALPNSSARRLMCRRSKP